MKMFPMWPRILLGTTADLMVPHKSSQCWWLLGYELDVEFRQGSCYHKRERLMGETVTWGDRKKPSQWWDNGVYV